MRNAHSRTVPRNGGEEKVITAPNARGITLLLDGGSKINSFIFGDCLPAGGRMQLESIRSAENKSMTVRIIRMKYSKYLLNFDDPLHSTLCSF